MLGKEIVIDKTKCDGCGLCVEACHEGALAIVDGKAELVRKDFCDGLGDCLPACPQNLERSSSLGQPMTTGRLLPRPDEHRQGGGRGLRQERRGGGDRPLPERLRLQPMTDLTDSASRTS